MVEGKTGNSEKSALRTLDEISSLYILPNEPFAEDVLIPAFRRATRVDCMVGFFSSAVLATIAPGLAAYIAGSPNSFRLVMSPYLRPEDQLAIEQGVKTAEEFVEGAVEQWIITEDQLERHTLRCLSYLLRVGHLEIKVALMRDGLFHPKVWIFDDGDAAIAAHGSSNLTHAGVKRNFEQVTVSRSWEDSNQLYIINKFREQFERLWDNQERETQVIPISRALKDHLIKSYPTGEAPTEGEFEELYRRAVHASPSGEPPTLTPPKRDFLIPAELRYEDGPYAHQGSAVTAWCENRFCGVLEMATGSGKTIASMICARRLADAHAPLLIVVAAPYVPLIQQWCGEIEDFGLIPTNLTTVSGPEGRARALSSVRRRLRTGVTEAEAVVVSHDGLCTERFQTALEKFDCARLLIADEVHNLGRRTFITNPPVCFEHRLGLSATPVRQYDSEGTDALFEFFGPVVFQFSLEEAIGQCLVEYDYLVHPVDLTDTEMDLWHEISDQIKRNIWRQEDNKPDEYLAKLYRDRRVVLETASQKISRLAELLDDEDLANIQHTLIYASDKAPDQLLEVNQLLRAKGILFHQLTAEETADRSKTGRIIQAFQTGEIQVLTAKRVLDEGVNIPQVRRAYVLASTTVERQWVQRRGRLLRRCDAIGKTHSIVHDFLALPPDLAVGLDPDAKALVRSELRRAQEFASLARNAGRKNGPLAIIDKLVDAAYL